MTQKQKPYHALISYWSGISQEKKFSPNRWSEIDFSVEKEEPRKKACNLKGLLNKSDDNITYSDIEAIDYLKTIYKTISEDSQKGVYLC